MVNVASNFALLKLDDEPIELPWVCRMLFTTME